MVDRGRLREMFDFAFSARQNGFPGEDDKYTRYPSDKAECSAVCEVRWLRTEGSPSLPLNHQPSTINLP